MASLICAQESDETRHPHWTSSQFHIIHIPGTSHFKVSSYRFSSFGHLFVCVEMTTLSCQKFSTLHSSDKKNNSYPIVLASSIFLWITFLQVLISPAALLQPAMIPRFVRLILQKQTRVFLCRTISNCAMQFQGEWCNAKVVPGPWGTWSRSWVCPRCVPSRLSRWSALLASSTAASATPVKQGNPFFTTVSGRIKQEPIIWHFHIGTG